MVVTKLYFVLSVYMYGFVKFICQILETLTKVILLILVSFCLVVTLLLPFTPSIVDWSVGKIFANVNEPGGGRAEPPQMSFPIPYSSADIQVHGGRGMKLSCSIPSSLDYIVFRDDISKDESISLQMRQACITHDYCYRHGAATYGYSQEDCDYQLLESALRLCYYLSDGQVSQDYCQIRAKKVLLGVRLGGGSSFKRVNVEDDYSNQRDYEKEAYEGSTYFEYELYPYMSQSFKVFRIADIPLECVNEGNSKGVYEFRIKPAGLKLTIWSAELDGYQMCRQLDIPGNHNYLTYVPIVVGRKPVAEENEDWLVWWQRYNMDTTGGRFVSIAPSRASLQDWQKLFPGATETFHVHEISSNPELVQNVNINTPAAFIAETGKAKSDENNFSEFYPAVGFATYRLNLFALRTHSCGDNSNALCYNHFELDPSAKKVWQKHEPFTVRDSQNEQGDGSDYGRYRNFAIPPIVIQGSDGKPSLAWIRRGSIEVNKGGTGADYDTRALLRRQVCERSEGECAIKNNTYLKSKSLGTVSLEVFTEQDEPILVINRKSEQPMLMGVRTSRIFEKWPLNYDWQLFDIDNREKTSLRYWKLPKSKVENQDSSKLSGSGSPVPDDIVIPKQFKGKCEEKLSSEWLIRPPVLYTSKNGTGYMLFSKVEIKNYKVYLNILSAIVKSNGTCEISKHASNIELDQDFGCPIVPKLQNLRKSPLFITKNEKDEGFLDVVIVNAKNVGKSLIKRKFIEIKL